MTRFTVESRDSGAQFHVLGEDAQDAAMTWARSQTLGWWQATTTPFVVLVNGEPYTITIDYDMSVTLGEPA